MTYLVIAVTIGLVLGITLGYWLAKHGFDFGFGTYAGASTKAKTGSGTLAVNESRTKEAPRSNAETAELSPRELLSAASRVYRDIEENRSALIQAEIDRSMTAAARATAAQILQQQLPAKLAEFVSKNHHCATLCIDLHKDGWVDPKWGLSGSYAGLKGANLIVYQTLESVGADPECVPGIDTHRLKIKKPEALR